jgi:hypothetical protein
MKRRSFLKFLGLAPAAPVVANIAPAQAVAPVAAASNNIPAAALATVGYIKTIYCSASVCGDGMESVIPDFIDVRNALEK